MAVEPDSVDETVIHCVETVVHQVEVIYHLRRNSEPRLPSRGGTQLLRLIPVFSGALVRRDYVSAAKVIQEIVMVATLTYAETVQMALRQQAGLLLLEKNNQVGNRDKGHDEVETQRRKKRNRPHHKLPG